MARRAGRTVGTASVVVLLSVAAAVTWVVLRPSAALMTASSSASGHAAGRAAPGVSGTWRSHQETAGAWLQRSWEEPVEVRTVTFRGDPASGAEKMEGYLRFSDGSQVSVRVGGSVTEVALTTRRVSWMRFTVSRPPRGQRAVGLAELDAGDDDGSDGGPVDTRAPAGGDVAPAARLTGGTSSLVDDEVGSSSVVRRSVLLRWDRPREVARLSVAGAARGATLRSATVSFSDGSTVPLGAVTSDSTRPTVVAFMPRSTMSVRLDVDSTEGEGRLRLSSLGVFQRGPAVARPLGANPTSGLEPTEPSVCQQSSPRPTDRTGVLVRCPTNGTIVDGSVRLDVAVGPSYTSVEAIPWGSGRATAAPAQATVDAEGDATLDLDVSGLGSGPFVVEVRATGAGPRIATAHLQLRRPGEPVAGDDAAPAGRSLVFEDGFDDPLSATSTGTGADYVVGKPEHSGVTGFGDAEFTDPARGLGNVAQSDGLLQLSVRPRSSGSDDVAGRGPYAGGMVASARPGGSGFSAQYGYFEARMMAPAEPGTWPAFWLLTNPNLVVEQPVVAEIDAVELYGHDPVSACHTSHQYPDPKKVGEALCGRRWQSPRAALAWHTYAVDVRPDRIRYFIDDVLVGEAPQVGAADEPMFFMLDLALGGGWPVDLASVRGRASLYVDWVRVYE